MSKNTDILIYNSLSRRVETLELNDKEELNMFVCGPTVYDYIHIGNARTFTFFDTFARFLRSKGIKLNYIQNITDIDDKIINRAEELKISPKELADQYTAKFIEDMRSIHADSQATLIRATDKIPEIIKQVEQLISKGNAYLIENDGYYFDLSSFPEYGKLSRRTTQMAEDGTSRIDDNPDKRNRGDFCVWKFKKDDKEPSWPAPFGQGRPGWHIEDTAITESVFGPQYDIHGGGQDLMFPHHEAEIAQQESASGLKPFVRYWIHCAFLINKEEKMSKSKGNFATLHEILEKISPLTGRPFPSEAIRYYFLSAHYRSPLNYNEDLIISAHTAIHSIYNSYIRILTTKNGMINKSHLSEREDFILKIKEQMQLFYDELKNDFNTPGAFGHLFKLLSLTNEFIDRLGSLDWQRPYLSEEIEVFLSDVGSILGIFNINTLIKEETLLNQRDQNEAIYLYKKRIIAREDKDYTKSDELRLELEALGYQVQDNPNKSFIWKLP